MGNQLLRRLSFRLASAFLLFLALVASTQGQQKKILFNFNSGPHAAGGNLPEAGLIRDAAGNLYGTASEGGSGSGGLCNELNGCGTVFELSEKNGTWTQTVLHNFNGDDGATPAAALAFDSAGDLFGTTLQGGGAKNCGTVFELKPKGTSWTFSTVYTFCSESGDGMYPRAQLIFDQAGNIFGTASEGGTADRGTAFELSPKSGGGWTFKNLHTFSEANNDGTYPHGGLAFDGFGNLWGATETGGSDGNDGTVYEFTPNGSGWKYHIVYVFQGFPADVCCPESALTFDVAGNMYGTAYQGGENNFGGVFKLQSTAGRWTETVLHNFAGSDGENVYYGNLAIDTKGNLYGTTLQGSGRSKYGTVFELSPSGKSWTETVLHYFAGNGNDGRTPYNGLIVDSSGNVYGTTSKGGTAGGGTVFEITP